jgi:hypothetical protein
MDDHCFETHASFAEQRVASVKLSHETADEQESLG